MPKVVKESNVDNLSATAGNILISHGRTGQPAILTPRRTVANATVTLTTDQVRSGYITSTSAAGTTLTLPLATDIIADMGLGAGDSFDLMIDNTAGASTVTVAVNTGVTQLVIVPDGGAGELTIAASATVGMGVFKFMVPIDAAGVIISRMA